MSLLNKDVVPKLLSSTQRRKIHKLWFLLLTISAFYYFIGSSPVTASPTAKTYYVAPNGNDSNAGTIDKPWRHISYATTNNIVKPGDTVLVRGGTYVEYIPQEISGSSGNYITYRNYPGETPIITDGSDERSWRWQIIDQSYIHIEGFVFRDYVEGAIQIRTRDEDLSNVELHNNSFINQEMNGNNSNKTVFVTTSTSGRSMNNIVIEGNYFNNLNTGVSSANEALMVSGDVSNVAIVGNTLSNLTNIGIDVSGRPDIGQPNKVLIKGNEVFNYGLAKSSAGGIYLDGAGSEIVIENNVVYDGPKGIHVNLEPAASDMKTEIAIIRNNTLYNNDINLKLGVAGAGDNCNDAGLLRNSVAVHNTIYADDNNTANHYFSCGENLRWKNNIWAHEFAKEGYQYKFVNQTVDATSWETDHNFFYNAGSLPNYYRWDSKIYSQLSHFQGNVNQDTNSYEGNPMFVDAGVRDFKLQSASPARDRGGALTSTSTSGSGKVISVKEAWYFSDGMGLQQGDIIRIGNSATAVVIVDVDYSNHKITIDRDMSWSANASVNYNFEGSAPDMGANEFSPTVMFSVIPQDQALLLNWKVNDSFDGNLTWKLEYSSSGQNRQTVNFDVHENSYRITNLNNYQVYDITLTALVDGDIYWSQTVNAMPTDIFVYLPIVNK